MLMKKRGKENEIDFALKPNIFPLEKAKIEIDIVSIFDINSILYAVENLFALRKEIYISDRKKFKIPKFI